MSIDHTPYNSQVELIVHFSVEATVIGYHIHRNVGTTAIGERIGMQKGASSECEQ